MLETPASGGVPPLAATTSVSRNSAFNLVFRKKSASPTRRKGAIITGEQKGRRTEIEFLNGLVVREGEKVGLTCRANDVLTDIVKRVERGELKPDPRHITELRLN
jgi:2-dehydropantoate 2-reductase